MYVPTFKESRTLNTLEEELAHVSSATKLFNRGIQVPVAQGML